MARRWHLVGLWTARAALPAAAGIIYVDDDAPAGGNGQSWATAFKFLQDALAVAQLGDEIRVAGGVHRADQDANNPVGTGDPSATFLIPSGVGIYGRYAGLSDPDHPDARDIQTYASHMSGLHLNYPNSYIVVTATTTTPGTRLDGLTIRDGYPDYTGYDPPARGAGMHITEGHLVVYQCVIVDIRTGYPECHWTPVGSGGGVYCRQADVTFVGSIIAQNIAGKGGWPCGNPPSRGGDGGGLCAVESSQVRMVSCTVAANKAGEGGESSNLGGGPGGRGGGVFVDASSGLEASNCLFAGNRAGDGGGASYSQGGNGGGGGAVFTASGNVELWGCTFDDNRAGPGGYGGYANGQPGHGGALYCGTVVPQVRNSILWNGTPGAVFGQPEIEYSDVAGGWSGLGNISADPLFLDADGPGNDPNTWADNDHLLSAGSPCIDACSNSYPPVDVLDLDNDGCVTDPLPVDLAWQARYQDDPATPDTGAGAAPIVDMGAYEFGLMPGVPAGPCPGDANCSGVIDSTTSTRSCWRCRTPGRMARPTRTVSGSAQTSTTMGRSISTT